MKQNILIMVLCICVITVSITFTGCFDTAHHTDVTVIAYEGEINNTYEGDYWIGWQERWDMTVGRIENIKGSEFYNFTVKNGDWIFTVDKDQNMQYPTQINFQTTDGTELVIILILIPEGGDVGDIDKDDIIIEGASKVW